MTAMQVARFVLVAVLANVALQAWTSPYVTYSTSHLSVLEAPPSTWPTLAPLEGHVAANEILKTASQRLPEEDLPGHAETVVFGADGRLYALLEGDVWSAAADGSDLQLYAHTGGRPLGGKFDAHGNLVYADAVHGLLMVEASSRKVVKLTDRVSSDSPLEPSSAIQYANDLDITASGLIYFSDACVIPPARLETGKYDTLGASIASYLQGPTGRLLSYNPDSGATHVVATGLWFANGVALSSDESFVAVAATFSARLYRHWLQGPKAGMTEPFADLPGVVDGLSRSADGGFWAAICSSMSPLVELGTQHRMLRFIMGWLPKQMKPKRVPGGMVVKVSPEGQLTQMLQDPTGKQADFVSAVTEHEGRLYLGSLAKKYVGVYDLTGSGSTATS